MGLYDPQDPQLQQWLRQQQQSGATGMNPSGVQLPGGGPRGIATPDVRSALPEQAPGGVMPPSWMQQRANPAWMAANAPGAMQQGSGAAPQPGVDAVAGKPSYDPSGAPVAQVAGAGAPAAAGAGAAALGGAAPYLAVLASFFQKKQGDDLARKNMMAQIYGQNAARNGAPTDSLEAAQLNQRLRQDPGQDYIAPLLKQYGRA